MLFDLEVLSFGKKQTIRFDNLKNEFIDLETGTKFLEAFHAKSDTPYTELFDIDFSNIGVLYITLGLKCNFSCKYCHQNHFRETTQVADCTPKKVTHLLEILRQKKDLHPRTIAIWGGEPLVYWKALKILLPGLRELYPTAKIDLPTNGSLLDSDVLETFKKYNVHFYISYDGKTTNRDASIFDRQELVDCLKEWGTGIDIMPTQNRASIPIKELKDEFSRMRLPLNSIATYAIARCNPFSRDQAEEIRIPQEKCNEYSNFIYDVIHDKGDNLELYRGLIKRFNHNLQFYFRGVGVNSKRMTFCPNCRAQDICIDCEGKIFNCMNIPVHVIGTLEKFQPFDSSKLFATHLKKKSCLECPYVTCCKGGCPLIHNDQSIEFKVNCHNLKIIAVPFFRTIIEGLLGVYLKKITRVSDGKVFGEW